MARQKSYRVAPRPLPPLKGSRERADLAAAADAQDFIEMSAAAAAYIERDTYARVEIKATRRGRNMGTLYAVASIPGRGSQVFSPVSTTLAGGIRKAEFIGENHNPEKWARRGNSAKSWFVAAMTPVRKNDL